jgi:serine/threonine-protein kinase HSL1, negative regulator of Swe1 kinase
LDESDEDSDDEFPYRSRNRHGTKHEDPASRQIEPQRSWIAKLFHVKPALKFVCFSVSKRKARKEIVKILKDWKRYGVRGVQVDKDRNIVFGRVAAKNCTLTYRTTDL